MRIDVTQADIDQAKREGREGHLFYNPIALALRGRDKYAVVTATHVYFANSGPHELPPTAMRFIAMFNAGKPISPCYFYLQGVS